MNLLYYLVPHKVSHTPPRGDIHVIRSFFALKLEKLTLQKTAHRAIIRKGKQILLDIDLLFL